MENSRQSQHLATMEPDDSLVREPLPPEARSSWSSWAWPQSTGTRVLLSALAALLVVTIVGTTALVLRDLRAQGSSSISTTPSVQATATVPSGTPTPVPARDPKDNGWTEYTAGVAGGRVVSGDVKFSASSPQRGYLCGQASNDLDHRLFAVSVNGGQTWQTSFSPAQFASCSLQISATNPLDVAISSYISSFGGDSPPTYVDSHYSTDGGKTWKAVPIPQGTLPADGAAWSGPYLYFWVGPSVYRSFSQQSSLQVSANGGAFTPIDLNSLLTGT